MKIFGFQKKMWWQESEFFWFSEQNESGGWISLPIFYFVEQKKI